MQKYVVPLPRSERLEDGAYVLIELEQWIGQEGPGACHGKEKPRHLMPVFALKRKPFHSLPGGIKMLDFSASHILGMALFIIKIHIPHNSLAICFFS